MLIAAVFCYFSCLCFDPNYGILPQSRGDLIVCALTTHFNPERFSNPHHHIFSLSNKTQKKIQRVPILNNNNFHLSPQRSPSPIQSYKQTKKKKKKSCRNTLNTTGAVGINKCVTRLPHTPPAGSVNRVPCCCFSRRRRRRVDACWVL
jgi:hypothetical protein